MFKIINFFKKTQKNLKLAKAKKISDTVLEIQFLANKEIAEERWSNAVEFYNKAIAIAPEKWSLYIGLGFSSLEAGFFQQAINALTMAVKLNPQSTDGWFLLGNAQKTMGLEKNAIQSWRNLLKLDEDFIHVYKNYILLLVKFGLIAEALNFSSNAVRRLPKEFDCHLYYANLLLDTNQIDLAISQYNEALSIRPNSAAVNANLGVAHRKNGDLQKSIHYSKLAIEMDLKDPSFFSNYLFVLQSSSEISVKEKFKEHLRYAEIFENPKKAQWSRHCNNQDHRRRLRIGYVSGDFCDHALRFFIEPVLKSHDHQNFEIFCYHTHVLEDKYTDRLRGYSDHWFQCAEWDDEKLASHIKDQAIDILIDLSGHTAHNRLPVFALKPAPVQVTWLGYMSTTGLSAIDWRITDQQLDPVGTTEAFNSEKLLRLSSAGIFSSDEHMAVIDASPRLPCMPFTFGCLHNPSKVSDVALDTWAAILQRAPEAQMLFGNSTPFYQERVTRHMTKFGVNSARLLFSERLSLNEYFNIHHQIDVMLDTFPYNGGTTTLHALSMGVPTIALQSDITISRVGEALMLGYGLPDFCCINLDEYISQAIHWSGQKKKLAELREFLPNAVAQKNNASAKMFTTDLEDGLRRIWIEWCNNKFNE